MNLKNLIFLLVVFMIAGCKVSEKAQTSNSTMRTTQAQPRSINAEQPMVDARTASMAETQEMAANEDCINSKVANSALRCPPTKAEVCGCNGITYKNSCEADKAGVTRFTTGPCGSNKKPSGTSNPSSTQ